MMEKLKGVKDVIILFGGFLTSLGMFLGTLGYSFTFLSETTVNALVVVLTAFAVFVFNAYAVWKNTNVFNKNKKEEDGK